MFQNTWLTVLFLKFLKFDLEHVAVQGFRTKEIFACNAISTVQVNANDDRGVLACRWNEPYYDGVAPYRWTGSVPILRQWSKGGTTAVKYGQCWVLAGVACTGETLAAPSLHGSQLQQHNGCRLKGQM